MSSPQDHWDVNHKGMNKRDLKTSFFANREYALSKDEYSSTTNDNYWALALSIRDRIVERWINTQQRYHKQNLKRVYYLSMEFLIGRLLGNNLYNLGLEKDVEALMMELGFDLEEIRNQELDAGLGNGGLGRLAACFLDSMASLGIPAHGYGIRYDYGIFNQKIENGYQMELPDEWLKLGSPWEFARSEYTQTIHFYGKVDMFKDITGKLICRWVDTQDVLAMPYDVPVPGYKNDVINTLRLWSARSTENFDFEYFNSGDYEQAVYKKIYSENISKVLYPNDSLSQGKELRLKQEYFFTAATISDILRRFKSENANWKDLPKQVVIQLNDTHPAIAIVELMRLLIDECFLEWEVAWEITRNCFAYTNHTLMPEALECWPVLMFEYLLPRHLQIIYEINYRFMKEVEAKFPGDSQRHGRMSIIEEGDHKKIRMANLAVVGSFSVNGVSNLHTELLKAKLMKDFYELYPEKFNNKTNGITQRRWLLKANPRLSDLITEAIGDGWVKDLGELQKLVALAPDASFQAKWRKIKDANKVQLIDYIHESKGILIHPHSMFDVQVKRMHEYKRQLLFTLYIISQYLQIKNKTHAKIQPRTFFIGGKAAPGYYAAKLIIKFINNVADVINADKEVHDHIKLVFLENYRVSLAEKIFPASELSEQISTAGTEASGTGNMKFMINGALTIGTYDGANIEMVEQVGDENIFIFGLRAHEVEELKHNKYQPAYYIHKSPVLEKILALISSGFFSKDNPQLFNSIVESLFYHDPYLICADFESYCQMQEEVSQQYGNAQEWTKKSILNVARSGFFSSDRTIAEYARDIWKVPTSLKAPPKAVKKS